MKAGESGSSNSECYWYNSGPMKYHIWTEGCQMNVADSQRVGSSLEHLGYAFTDKPEDADVIVLNTCVVRQSAEEKALGRVTSLRPLPRGSTGSGEAAREAALCGRLFAAV
jgi:Ni,Fe-hydrogenase III small subunit